MPTTATAVLNVARSQIGYREGFANDNMFGRWYGWNNEPYCAMFQSWTFAQVDALDLVYGKHAYCPYWVRDFKAHGQWLSWHEAPRRGDIVFYDWTGHHDVAVHVGIVESYDAAHNVVIAIEANTTSGVQLSANQSDGGGVYRRRRNTLYVVGYGRPAYTAERNVRPLPPHAGRSTRTALPLLVDGRLGRKTAARAAQWLHYGGDPVTGVDKLGDAVLTVAFWKVLQRKVGGNLGPTGADGKPGKFTYAAIERYAKAPVTGRRGPAVKALQRMLNRL